MRVLDLDMDFFLTGVCELAPRGARPSLREARPWAEADVRAFLEENCGLSRQTPIPGRVFETHDGALFFWKEWLEAGKLSAPFHVTHVDAHSDLGIGKPGPAYVLETVLALPPQARGDLSRYVREEKLDEANYLLFALALRYVSSLENVRNPHSRADFPRPPRRGRQPAAHGHPPILHACPPAAAVRFCRAGHSLYGLRRLSFFPRAAPYDLASLAISPRYAPKEADFIADVFREYITEV